MYLLKYSSDIKRSIDQLDQLTKTIWHMKSKTLFNVTLAIILGVIFFTPSLCNELYSDNQSSYKFFTPFIGLLLIGGVFINSQITRALLIVVLSISCFTSLLNIMNLPLFKFAFFIQLSLSFTAIVLIILKSFLLTKQDHWRY